MKEISPNDRIVDFQWILIELARSFLETEPTALDQGILEALEKLRLAVRSPCMFFSLIDEDSASILKTYLTDESGSSGPHSTPEDLAQLGILLPDLGEQRIIRSDDLPVQPGSWPCCSKECPRPESCTLRLIERDSKIFAILGHACDEEQWCIRREVEELLHAGAEILCHAIGVFQTKIELRDSRERLELAQWAARSVAWDWDPATDRMYISKSAADVWGYEPSVIPRMGKELQDRIPQEDRVRVNEAIRGALKNGTPYLVEHRFLMPDDKTMLWVNARGRPLMRPDGSVYRLIGMSVDITERKNMEAVLREEEIRAEVTLSSVAEAVIRTDAEGRVDFLNPRAEVLLGWDREKAVGKYHHEIIQLLPEKEGPNAEEMISRCLKEGVTIKPMQWYRLFHRSGKEYSVQVSVSPLRLDAMGIIGAVMVIQDLNELRKLEREKAYLASHDPLTNLLNRYEFEEQVKDLLLESAQRGGTHALCFLDLDTFKIVNDACGHVAGDEMLRQVSALLEATARGTDILARIGGDEFGLLMRDCSLEEARVRAEGIIHAAESFRFLAQNRIFSLGISIGIIPIDERIPPFGDLLAAADAACYLAREKGRNTYHIARPDDQEISRRSREVFWAQKINVSLQKGKFLLFAQEIHPILEGGRPMVELLLRMQDGSQLVGPEVFLGAAERYHLMPEIDRWVIHEALNLIARASRNGDADGRIYTINLSGQSLSQEKIQDYLLDEFEQSGVNPGQICFEITETAAIADIRSARNLMDRLNAIGAFIALDDFGSGLSSFRYLKDLPIQYLKIDGSLVRDIVNDPIQRSMVAAIKSIADTMGLKTIGEWVESLETLRTLGEIGLDYAQGFVLDRPHPWEF